MVSNVMKHRTLEEKAAILAEYDRLPHGSKRQVLVSEKISTGHIQMYRKQLDEHFGNGKTAKEVIEVSAEPDIDELIYQAIDHAEDAQRIIDVCRCRMLAGMNGIVTKKYEAALVSAHDMLKIVKLDLTMAAICNEIM